MAAGTTSFEPDFFSSLLRFSVSLRAVEERLLERGIEVSYETLRRWVAKFGPVFARGLRKRQERRGRVWHLDEVRVAIRGRRFWLWRAVDENSPCRLIPGAYNAWSSITPRIAELRRYALGHAQPLRSSSPSPVEPANGVPSLAPTLST